jgi:YHS domain-containing protein
LAEPRLEDCVNDVCPWSGEPVQADSLTRYKGRVVGFCNPDCRDKFDSAARAFDGAIESKD